MCVCVCVCVCVCFELNKFIYIITSSSPSGVGMSDKCSGFPLYFPLLYLSILDFQTSHQIYMFQERNYHDLIWAHCYFIQNQIIHCFYQNRFLENYYIIPKLDHIHFFPFFCVCIFSLINLFRSLENSTSGDYFDLRERLDNICKTYSYSYILDMIYCSFQVLFFLF